MVRNGTAAVPSNVMVDVDSALAITITLVMGMLGIALGAAMASSETDSAKRAKHEKHGKNLSAMIQRDVEFADRLANRAHRVQQDRPINIRQTDAHPCASGVNGTHHLGDLFMTSDAGLARGGGGEAVYMWSADEQKFQERTKPRTDVAPRHVRVIVQTLTIVLDQDTASSRGARSGQALPAFMLTQELSDGTSVPLEFFTGGCEGKDDHAVHIVLASHVGGPVFALRRVDGAKVKGVQAYLRATITVMTPREGLIIDMHEATSSRRKIDDKAKVAAAEVAALQAKLAAIDAAGPAAAAR